MFGAQIAVCGPQMLLVSLTDPQAGVDIDPVLSITTLCAAPIEINESSKTAPLIDEDPVR